MADHDNALPAPIILTFEQARQVSGAALNAYALTFKYAGPMPPALLGAMAGAAVLPAVQSALLPAV